MRAGLPLSVTFGLVLAACSTRPHARAPLSPPEPYVRLSQSGSNRFELQIAARKFTSSRRKTPAVWLTGVSHVGETNYFAALQQHLDAQSLVLFEGVGDHPAGDRATAPPDARPSVPNPAARGGPASLQSTLAASLGLAFQLEAIDYQRAHFRNSDLSVAQIRQLMDEAPAAAGQASGAQTFDALIQMMEGNSLFDGILRLALGFLGSNPKMQALTKLALIETIAQIKGDPSQFRALPPQFKQLLDVLIQKRNQKVMDDLAAELQRRPPAKTISIFYGTGHMPDLEMHLREQLNYRPAGQIWFTAISVDLAKAGVSLSEADFIRSLIKRQLDQAQSGR